MAESFAFDIAHSLLGKLASYAYEEASRAYGVYKDLQGFKNTLSIVSGVLLDAERKKDQKHEGVREWLRQIQNICYDAEDVLDGFELQDKRKQVVEASGSTRVKVCHFFSFSNSLAFRFRMAHQIKEIRDRLDKVAADGARFGLNRINGAPKFLQPRNLTTSYVDGSSVIGRDNDMKEIIKLLNQPHPQGDTSFSVIPIVGIAGLGKTTLAQWVYNEIMVDFQLHMWVHVSNDFDIKQLIIKIIYSISSHEGNINNYSSVQLVSLLKSLLSGKKYLLVLDDIWNDDHAKWTQLKNWMKNGVPGCKIIVTTRSKSIASMMGTVPSYVLNGLSLENCLSLLVETVFGEGEKGNFPNLMEIGKEIVRKCGGVPLAVKTLGRSLILKFDLKKWEFVRDSEIWNLAQEEGDILHALKRSYDKMPSYLRHCFAYFSLYPKDYSFSSNQIASLWIALRLIESQDESQNLETMAREYIEELHSMSFLVDFEDHGHFCNFKVHKLVHDLALYVAKEECVLVKSQTRKIPEQVMHLSIVENDPLVPALFPKSKQVRTILFPIHRLGIESDSLLDAWVSRYKYLRVLDLSDSLIVTLPNSIAKLEHLRVLNLANNYKIKRLPRSICKLQNLQVLIFLGCTELETLPKGLWKLISLRELSITTKQSVLPQSEFACFNHLRTLEFDRCDNLKFLFNGEHQLTSLESLTVKSCGSLESLRLSSFPKLQALFLADCKKLNLSLNNEKPIQRFQMKHLYLEEFPGLLTLPRWIEGVSDTLETLVIKKFPNLEMLPESLTTMIHLKRLHIRLCPQLLTLPNDIRHLTRLEDLRIHCCPELCQKCRPEFGEYWSMISHIKNISIGEKNEVIDLEGVDDEACPEQEREM